MKRILIFIAVLIFAYLCGAFFSMSFDISFWTKNTRGAVVLFGFTFAFALASFPYIDEIFK
jgi:hypothetical protein